MAEMNMQEYPTTASACPSDAILHTSHTIKLLFQHSGA